MFGLVGLLDLDTLLAVDYDRLLGLSESYTSSCPPIIVLPCCR